MVVIRYGTVVTAHWDRSSSPFCIPRRGAYRYSFFGWTCKPNDGQESTVTSPGHQDLPEERIGPGTAYWYERHLFAYRLASARLQQSDAIAVDLGCGKGYGLSEMSAETRFVIGIDRHLPTLQSLEIRRVDGIALIGGDVRRIPLRDETVDVVVTFQVIEHLAETDSFLSEITRVLKPGGEVSPDDP